MSGVNVQISMTNLTQMDRHQNDLHRLPAVHHEQNAAMQQDAVQRRISMPVEPDTVENKTVDPEQRKRDINKRKNIKRKIEKKKSQRYPLSDPDHFVDLQA